VEFVPCRRPQLPPGRSLDDAIALADDTPFGLGAVVWSADEDNQRRRIAELDADSVTVNTMTVSYPRLLFGGIKAGIREFCNLKDHMSRLMTHSAPRDVGDLGRSPRA
jgi:hypothetical protein